MRRSITGFVAIMAVLALPCMAAPRDTYATRPAAFWHNLAAQHTHSLQSKHPQIVKMTLKQMAWFARHYPDYVRYDQAMAQLRTLSKSERRSIRTAASQTLSAIYNS